MGGQAKAAEHILVVRLGAMGDILHTLPAVARLRQGHQTARLTWLVEPKWAPLVDDNPYVDRVVWLRRESVAGLLRTRRELRAMDYDFAVDFQGLFKSALPAWAAGPERIYGFDRGEVRERAAAWFYSDPVRSTAAHVVDRNMELVAACGGARSGAPEFPLPDGKAEGKLPAGDFVLASPLAGWASKQWPMEHYGALAARLKNELNVPLVLDGPAGADFSAATAAIPHRSSLEGLIHATRRAAAVIGVDSGPMHLAAALAKPGAALFGPTDPARNGPYGGSLRVLRCEGAETTYKRGTAISESMRKITVDEVFEAVREALAARCMGERTAG
jgi:heptosyltransferase I